MKTLWPRIRGIVFFGWLIAAIRLILDATVHPAEKTWGWWIGVDILLPIAFIVVGIKGTLDDVPWPKYLLIALVFGVLIWGVPNLISYTTGQFMGWQHGRFEPMVKEPGKFFPKSGHAPPLADSAGGKILTGLQVAGGSAAFGTVASLLVATLLIWLPGKIRRNRRAQPAT
jgi:hypothetical protein